MHPRLDIATSHQFAKTILEHVFPAEYEGLLTALEGITIPLNPAGPFSKGKGQRPKRQQVTKNNQKRYQLFPVSQKGWNEAIRNALQKQGWKKEPIAAGAGHKSKPKLKGDFVRNTVFVEVEFGNVASAYRDLFKFLVAHDNGQAKVGVLITAFNRLGSLMDQGIASHESAERNILPYLRVTPMPILFIGLDYKDEDRQTLISHYDAMYKVAVEGGVDCHPSAVIFGKESEDSQTENGDEEDEINADESDD